MRSHSELERDLELERRKVRDLQEASRERDKEYQKLKVCFGTETIRTNTQPFLDSIR